jgi:hypothetical protein
MWFQCREGDRRRKWKRLFFSFANWTMTMDGGACYDPATIDLLKAALETAWASLSKSRQGTVLKTELAQRILTAARAGERDPQRLVAHALMKPMDLPGIAPSVSAQEPAVVLAADPSRN